MENKNYLDVENLYNFDTNDENSKEQEIVELRKKSSKEQFDIVFNKISGIDNDGMPNSSIFLNNEIIDGVKEKDIEDKNKHTSLSEHISYKPKIEIKTNGEFVILDLIFNSALDPELGILFSHLEKFGKEVTKILTEHLEKTALSSLVVTPTYYDGEYFFSLVNPIFWCKMPSDNTRADANMIRLLYKQDSMFFYSLNDFDANKQREEFERMEKEKDVVTLKEKEI